MARRARSIVVSTEVNEEKKEEKQPFQTTMPYHLMATTVRLLPLFRKMDEGRYFTDLELDKVCKMVAGDERRAIQRVLIGLYQRALEKKDDEMVKKARMMISLHDSNRLKENLQ